MIVMILLGIGCLVAAFLSKERRVGCSISGLTILAIAFGFRAFGEDLRIVVVCSGVALAVWFASIYVGQPHSEILDPKQARRRILTSLGATAILSIVALLDREHYIAYLSFGGFGILQSIHEILGSLRTRKVAESQNVSRI